MEEEKRLTGHLLSLIDSARGRRRAGYTFLIIGIPVASFLLKPQDGYVKQAACPSYG